jgi:flavin-dependent dehydrogenase
MRVALLDKADFPRPKLCGGLLTAKTVRILERMFPLPADAFRRGRILYHSSRRYAVFARRHPLYCGCLEQPFWFADRYRYDRFLVACAAEAGADVLLKTRVAGFRRLSNPASVEVFGERRLRGRFLIGADGVFSRVRRKLHQEGRVGRPLEAAAAAALEVVVPRCHGSGHPDHPQLFFGYTRSGYAWVFPGTEGHLAGMLTMRRPGRERLRRAFSFFLQDVLPGIDPSVKPRGGALPYGGFLERPGAGTVLLAGDAAGFADPLLGEGVFYAHRSGELAAAAVLDSLRQPAVAADRYARMLSETILPELRAALRWRRLLYSAGRAGGYLPVAFVLRRFHRPCEAAVQGNRSFSLLRKKNRAVGFELRR